MSTIAPASPVTVRRTRVTFVVHSLHCDRCNRELLRRKAPEQTDLHYYRCPLCGAALVTATEYPYGHREIEIP